MKEQLTFLFLLFTSTVLFGQSNEGYKFVFVYWEIDGQNTDFSKEVIASHKSFIREHSKSGLILTSGPFEEGGGLAIFNLDKIKVLDSLMAFNLAVQNQTLKMERYYWKPRTGIPCNHRSPGVYEAYTFVKFDTNITKFNVRWADQYFRNHDLYLKQFKEQGMVVSEGVFNNLDGTTIVLTKLEDYQVIMQDPMIAQGFLTPVIKTVWLPKNAFCKD